MKEQQIVKSNALVEAHYRLTLNEQRLLLACIAQIRRDQPLTDERLYSVTVQALAELAGMDSTALYRDLREAVERLFERRVTIYQQPNGKGSRRLVTRWVQTAVYMDEAGRVELRFGRDIIPYLSELTERFTRYGLGDVAKMTSSHAVRLYELLVQYRTLGKREIEIDWLKRTLEIEDCYRSIKDFKRRVLGIAVEQINRHSPLRVKWSQRKTGRKVTHLIFEIEDAKPAKPTRTKPAPTETMIFGVRVSEIERLAYPGETYEQAAARICASKDKARNTA